MTPLLLAAALAAGAPASAAAYGPAPWWMRQPVIASLGAVRTELTANRATLGAAFEAIDRSVGEALRAAADKVRALDAALATYGAERVRVTTTFSTRPLYAQYRDKDGQLQENARDDKIDRYAVTADVVVELRDTRLAEGVYAALIAARPTSTRPASFRLEPSNETNTELFGLAVDDAARRARLAATATGARLGAVKLIDPTGRACQTDVLVAGAPRSLGGDDAVQQVVVTAAKRFAATTPSPASAVAQPAAVDPAALEAARLPLEPPLETIGREACVVYALGPPSEG